MKKTQCTGCKAVHDIPSDQFVGKRVTCKDCGEKFICRLFDEHWQAAPPMPAPKSSGRSLFSGEPAPKKNGSSPQINPESTVPKTWKEKLAVTRSYARTPNNTAFKDYLSPKLIRAVWIISLIFFAFALLSGLYGAFVLQIMVRSDLVNSAKAKFEKVEVEFAEKSREMGVPPDSPDWEEEIWAKYNKLTAREKRSPNGQSLYRKTKYLASLEADKREAKESLDEARSISYFSWSSLGTYLYTVLIAALALVVVRIVLEMIAVVFDILGELQAIRNHFDKEKVS